MRRTPSVYPHRLSQQPPRACIVEHMWKFLLVALLAAACGGCADGDLGPDLGGRCQNNAECSERCLPDRDYPGGFCTLNCDSDSDCTRGAICMAREGGVCLLPCSAFAQCEFLGQGWDCAVIDSKNSPQRMRGVCVGD